jgi:hypothetical protein
LEGIYGFSRYLSYSLAHRIIGRKISFPETTNLTDLNEIEFLAQVLTALIQMRKDVLKPVHLAPHFVEYLSLK